MSPCLLHYVRMRPGDTRNYAPTFFQNVSRALEETSFGEQLIWGSVYVTQEFIKTVQDRGFKDAFMRSVNRAN